MDDFLLKIILFLIWCLRSAFLLEYWNTIWCTPWQSQQTVALVSFSGWPPICEYLLNHNYLATRAIYHWERCIFSCYTVVLFSTNNLMLYSHDLMLFLRDLTQLTCCNNIRLKLQYLWAYVKQSPLRSDSPPFMRGLFVLRMICWSQLRLRYVNCNGQVSVDLRYRWSLNRFLHLFLISKRCL